MIRQSLGKCNLMNPLKIILPISRVEESINSRQDWNFLVARPSKTHAFQRWINQIRRINECGNSLIAEVNRLPDNFSKENLTTLKSHPQHRGIFHRDMKVNNSSHKLALNGAFQGSVFTTTLAVLINGPQLTTNYFFLSSRGLEQCDPSQLFFFILIVILSQMLSSLRTPVSYLGFLWKDLTPTS